MWRIFQQKELLVQFSELRSGKQDVQNLEELLWKNLDLSEELTLRNLPFIFPLLLSSISLKFKWLLGYLSKLKT